MADNESISSRNHPGAQLVAGIIFRPASTTLPRLPPEGVASVRLDAAVPAFTLGIPGEWRRRD